MLLLLFDVLIVVHITCGVTGAITFWVAVGSKKGGRNHRKWGWVFTVAMLITGTCALAMSLLTLSSPYGTHPEYAADTGRIFLEESFIIGMFGWLMVYMGLLTVSLAWHGWLCVKYRNNRAAIREWRNMTLMVLVLIASINCAYQGWLIGAWLMMLISMVGIATFFTNVWFLYRPQPAPMDYLKEHVKSLVGAGISVYTAFMAFGSVRIIPELALNPITWLVPLSTGIGIILWHYRKIDLQVRARQQPNAVPAE